MKAMSTKGFSVLALALIGLASPMASAQCLGEAQVVAKIVSIEAITGGQCLAKVQVISSVENQLCPLYANEIEARGIVTKADNFQCLDSVGGDIRRVVEVAQDGMIQLAH